MTKRKKNKHTLHRELKISAYQLPKQFNLMLNVSACFNFVLFQEEHICSKEFLVLKYDNPLFCN
jgi:hypothetical protein